MPKINVDPQLCIGCQTCVQIYPKIFEFDQKTQKAIVKNPEVNAESKQSLNLCPVAAISIKN
jgi:ferredoxin